MMNSKTWATIGAFAWFGLSHCAPISVQKSKPPVTMADPRAPWAEASVGPQMPLAEYAALPEPVRKELATVFADEFCYCGCPHTLGACLTEHAQCSHAQRMAKLAVAQAVVGIPAVEILASLSKYYQSFSEKRATLTVEEGLCHGNPQAKVTLVEFSDFQCPFCASMVPVLAEVLKQRPEVRICYKPYPLSMHPQAFPAAQTALFAKERGKFWPMHDALFQNQARLGRGEFKRLAKELKLDATALDNVLDSKKFEAEIQASQAEGMQAQLQGTPTIYLNGRKVTLGLSADILVHSIDDELEWLTHNQAWAAD